MKHWLFTLLLSVLVSTQASALEVGEVLPQDLHQELFGDTDVVYVVDFFAQWCVSCRIELPEINQLFSQLKDNSQVRFVGVDVDEDVAVAEAFQRSLGLEFPIVNDPQGRVIGAFAPLGMPALYYVVNGQIKGRRLGAIPHIDGVIRSDIQQLGVSL